MATTTVATRCTATLAARTQNLFKLLSFSSSSSYDNNNNNNLLNKSFSTSTNVSSSTTTSSGAVADASSTKPKKRKSTKKNLFEVAQFLPNYGLGYHMAKTHWTNVSYQITKINLYKDGRHGKAWGIVHKDGLQAADAPKKISGVHKRCWRYLKATEGVSNTAKATEKPSTAEAQPA